MDISNLFALSSAEIKIKHPITGEVLFDEGKGKNKLPMTITVMGTHTREYKKLAREAGFAAIKRNKKHDIEKMSVEEFEAITKENEEAALDLHAKAVLGCNIVMDGKKLSGSAADVKFMFTDERTSWIYEQFKAALEDEKLFFKG